MASGYKIIYNNATVDLSDVYMEKQYFVFPLWLWGANSYSGQLGDDTGTDRSSPVQTITGGTDWKQVACSLPYIESFTAAIQDLG